MSDPKIRAEKRPLDAPASEPTSAARAKSPSQLPSQRGRLAPSASSPSALADHQGQLQQRARSASTGRSSARRSPAEAPPAAPPSASAVLDAAVRRSRQGAATPPPGRGGATSSSPPRSAGRSPDAPSGALPNNSSGSSSASTSARGRGNAGGTLAGLLDPRAAAELRSSSNPIIFATKRNSCGSPWAMASGRGPSCWTANTGHNWAGHEVPGCRVSGQQFAAGSGGGVGGGASASSSGVRSSSTGRVRRAAAAGDVSLSGGASSASPAVSAAASTTPLSQLPSPPLSGSSQGRSGHLRIDISAANEDISPPVDEGGFEIVSPKRSSKELRDLNEVAAGADAEVLQVLQCSLQMCSAEVEEQEEEEPPLPEAPLDSTIPLYGGYAAVYSAARSGSPYAPDAGPYSCGDTDGPSYLDALSVADNFPLLAPFADSSQLLPQQRRSVSPGAAPWRSEQTDNAVQSLREAALALRKAVPARPALGAAAAAVAAAAATLDSDRRLGNGVGGIALNGGGVRWGSPTGPALDGPGNAACGGFEELGVHRLNRENVALRGALDELTQRVCELQEERESFLEHGSVGAVGSRHPPRMGNGTTTSPFASPMRRSSPVYSSSPPSGASAPYAHVYPGGYPGGSGPKLGSENMVLWRELAEAGNLSKLLEDEQRSADGREKALRHEKAQLSETLAQCVADSEAASSAAAAERRRLAAANRSLRSELLEAEASGSNGGEAVSEVEARGHRQAAELAEAEVRLRQLAEENERLRFISESSSESGAVLPPVAEKSGARKHSLLSTPQASGAPASVAAGRPRSSFASSNDGLSAPMQSPAPPPVEEDEQLESW